ncbi:MAG: hypothetical protein LBQ66_04535 [Planctomycetaceae bacterium]|nr:hypothetical protein [Planctomycetaceae bacterium]
MGNRPPGGYVFGERSKPKTEGAENVIRQRKVGNRPLGGYVFGERSKPKTVGRKTL